MIIDLSRTLVTPLSYIQTMHLNRKWPLFDLLKIFGFFSLQLFLKSVVTWLLVGAEFRILALILTEKKI